MTVWNALSAMKRMNVVIQGRGAAEMANRMMKYFEYKHLPMGLKEVSKACCILAESMDHDLDESPEKTAGLRKLLEAKDCFVRAKLDMRGDS